MNQLLKKISIILLGTFLFGEVALGQKIAVERVEPMNWWTGMTSQNLQLLIYGKAIGTAEVALEYEGVYIKAVHKADSPDYLFVDLEIRKSARPGSFPLIFKKDNKKVATYSYHLYEKGTIKDAQQGLDARDVIYLITPDRFVNADPKNDMVKNYKDGLARDKDDGRHGGDLAGVISKLDYLQDLGITTLWLNPVLENNMAEVSYHGYSTTDYYKVDPRYGDNEMYKNLSRELHKRDMKLVMDMIFNHCGLEHWWVKNQPFEDWIHDPSEPTFTNHAIAAVSDPYAASSDLKLLEKGWFVPTMPDLNHENPFMAKYLIQNSIWWIEYAGLDGIRMDTYPYNNKEMMVEWVKAVKTEYPDFFLLGETWVDNEPQEAFWAGKNPGDNGIYNSLLTSITDFPLCNAINNTFKENGNIGDLYQVLSNDHVYYASNLNTIFADNHDMDRVFHNLGEDPERFKQAITFLLTTRGIPQIYYGTEILMKGNGSHGVIREDFLGGWTEDSRNAFSSEGRKQEENEAFEYLKKLLNWRKQSKAIISGSLKHFAPDDNIYVYNRISGDESILVIINNNNEAKELDMARFSEVIEDCSAAEDVLSGKMITDLKTVQLEGNSSMVLLLKP